MTEIDNLFPTSEPLHRFGVIWRAIGLRHNSYILLITIHLKTRNVEFSIIIDVLVLRQQHCPTFYLSSGSLKRLCRWTCCRRWSSEQVKAARQQEFAGCYSRRTALGDWSPHCTGTSPLWKDQSICSSAFKNDSPLNLYRRDRVQLTMEDDMMTDMVVSLSREHKHNHTLKDSSSLNDSDYLSALRSRVTARKLWWSSSSSVTPSRGKVR